MRSLLTATGTCLVLPIVLFAALHYPEVDAEVERRLPLLPVRDIARQLEAEVAQACTLHTGTPPNFGRILEDYGKLRTSDAFLGLSALSRSHKHFRLPEQAVARFITWYRNVPHDLLTSDPVATVLQRLEEIGRKEKRLASQRDQMLIEHMLQCLSYDLPRSRARLSPRMGLPPPVIENGLVFCGESIPLDREDVRLRIEHQIDVLLTDLRSTTEVWLKRKDRYGSAVETILIREETPRELALLPALESGYSPSVVSPSMATGWWQFRKATAVNSDSPTKSLDWTLRVDQWRDERRDLVLSTRAAARYLKWIRARFSDGGKPCGWLMSAAAYNAGFAETGYRTSAYDTLTYWDVKLPRETEDYVPRWIALWIIDLHRSFYDMDLPPIAPLEMESLEGVRLARDLPLEVLAAMTSSSVRFIREMNGTLHKGASRFKAKVAGSQIVHTIHVPKGAREVVLKTLKLQGYI